LKQQQSLVAISVIGAGALRRQRLQGQSADAQAEWQGEDQVAEYKRRHKCRCTYNGEPNQLGFPAHHGFD
jgi:hypothetical protein